MSRTSIDNFTPPSLGPAPDSTIELNVSEIEDAGIASLLQTPGAAYGARSSLDALLSPTSVGTPFIFKQPLGQACELKASSPLAPICTPSGTGSHTTSRSSAATSPATMRRSCGSPAGSALRRGLGLSIAAVCRRCWPSFTSGLDPHELLNDVVAPYTGLAIIDVPGEFSGEAIGDKKNFIVQPFIDLLKDDAFEGAQLIITGAAFTGLVGVHVQALSQVHVA